MYDFTVDINSRPYLDDCDDPMWLEGLVRDGIDYSIAVKDNKPYMRGDVVPTEEIPGIKIDMSPDKIKKIEDNHEKKNIERVQDVH